MISYTESFRKTWYDNNRKMKILSRISLRKTCSICVI